MQLTAHYRIIRMQVNIISSLLLISCIHLCKMIKYPFFTVLHFLQPFPPMDCLLTTGNVISNEISETLSDAFM